jgi:tripartite-type tricarboxylate transporter receptor subunit TctC
MPARADARVNKEDAMKLSTFAKLAAAAACLALAPTPGSAQTYPSKPIKFIVPAPPGGAIDILARLVGEKLAVSMGQPVIVENKPGASNNLGTDLISKGAPDGYTIGIVGGSHNINKYLFKDLGWDPETSFEPIVYTHVVPLVFAIHPGVPAKTLPELIAWFKANPDKAKVATSGRGSAQEMAAEMLQMMSGAKLLMVPYKGSSQAHPDLLAGRTALYIDTISAIQGHIKSGAVRAIAVSTAKRSPAMPNLASADEQGLKGYDANTNGGILAPAGTPKDIVAKLNAEINKALKQPDVVSKLEGAGIQIQGGSPAEYAALIKSDLAKWKKVIDAAGLQPE